MKALKSLLVFMAVCLFATTGLFGQFGEYAKLVKSEKYPEALSQLLASVRENPERSGPLKSLGNKYGEIAGMIENDIASLLDSSRTFVGEKTVWQRKRLVEIYTIMVENKKVATELGIKEIAVNKKTVVDISIPDFSGRIEASEQSYASALEQAADMHDQAGKRLMKLGGIDNYKSAALEFKRAQSFVPDYRNTGELYQTCKEKGTTYIAIYPFQNQSGNTTLTAYAGAISSNIARKVAGNANVIEFLSILSEQELTFALSKAGFSYGKPLSPTDWSKVKNHIHFHELWTGEVKSFQQESPQTTVSDTKTHTDRKITGYKEIRNSKNEVTGKEPIYSDISAYYVEKTTRYNLKVNTNYSHILFSDTGAPQAEASEFNRTNNVLVTWTERTGGDPEVYKKVDDPKTAVPDLMSRIDAVLAALASHVADSIIAKELKRQVPLVKTLAEVNSGK